MQAPIKTGFSSYCTCLVYSQSATDWVKPTLFCCSAVCCTRGVFCAAAAVPHCGALQQGPAPHGAPAAAAGTRAGEAPASWLRVLLYESYASGQPTIAAAYNCQLCTNCQSSTCAVDCWQVQAARVRDPGGLQLQLNVCSWLSVGFDSEWPLLCTPAACNLVGTLWWRLPCRQCPA
jgi:hypothetical protein